ncbi:MAG: cytochrome P450 [Chloroflexi bacterium]|nr:cytochrome P450 [Chloroflexota bacterium]
MTQAPLAIDFADPALIANPYPVYKMLRETDPCMLVGDDGPFVLTRYADVDEVLRDFDRFSNQRDRGRDEDLETDQSMLNRDPPDHTRLRGLVSRAFTPRRIATMEAHIRETAHELLDEVAGEDEFDLMTNLAALLPTVVIAEMIGVPSDDREQFKAWSTDIIGLDNPSPELAAAGEAARDSLWAYFADQVERRRHDPAEDLITRLIAAEEEGDQLSTNELIATLILLLLAGNETTTNLIGNGLKALLEHPDQLELLRAQPELLDSAVEELLRYDAPVQLDPRVVLREIEYGGKIISPDRVVFPFIGAANRDPEEFSEPDALDIRREDAGNISFGRGIHFCLGAPLARLEGKIAFEALIDRFSAIDFGSRMPVYKRNLIFRGFESFPIVVQRS